MNQGERVRFIVHNSIAEPTSIHWHGMDLPNPMDGVPGITQPEIAPGATFTYEYTAISAGTHWYHSHMHGDQEGRGVFGALEVVPLIDDIAADRDYTTIFSDGPLGFVLNGRSFPGTIRMPARVGDRVRIRVIGAGPDLIHSIHLHSGYFQVVAQDGRRLPSPYEADTILLGVGQTFDLIWIPTRVGHWMFHCHIFQHSETKRGMTGMVTFFDVYLADGAAAPAVPRHRRREPGAGAASSDARAVPRRCIEPASGHRMPASLPAASTRSRPAPRRGRGSTRRDEPPGGVTPVRRLPADRGHLDPHVPGGQPARRPRPSERIPPAAPQSVLTGKRAGTDAPAPDARRPPVAAGPGRTSCGPAVAWPSIIRIETGHRPRGREHRPLS